jgi:TetR/AcrR family transcriptional repressor of nem operon
VDTQQITKRAALLKATKDLLWERGYEGTSPRDILDRSGAGQGSLYHHFEGKLDLAGTALEEVSLDEIKALDRLFAKGDDPVERVRTYLRFSQDPFRGCRLGRLAHETAIVHDEIRHPIQAYLDRVKFHLEACLLRAQETGRIKRDVDVRAAAIALVAIVQGAYILARADHNKATMKAVIGGAEVLLASLMSSPV